MQANVASSAARFVAAGINTLCTPDSLDGLVPCELLLPCLHLPMWEHGRNSVPRVRMRHSKIRLTNPREFPPGELHAMDGRPCVQDVRTQCTREG
jgi:hypothetical protein